MDAVKAMIPRRQGSIDRLVALAAADMAGVDAIIRARMQSPVSVIPALADHIVNAGGKRLRPLLAVAAARLAGARGDFLDWVELHGTVTATRDEFLACSTSSAGPGLVVRPGLPRVASFY